jgi:hypothetical protein
MAVMVVPMFIAEEYVYGAVQSDQPLHGQRLHNADGSGAALYEHCKERTNRNPTSGWEKLVIACWNQTTSLSGAIDELMMSMPMNRIPRPASTWPMLCGLDFFREHIQRHAHKREYGRDGGYLSAMSCAVIVVPMFAPMMTPMARGEIHQPGVTKPTAMTVVALELCISTVSSNPTSNCHKPGCGELFQYALELEPAKCSRPSPIMRMPYRNSARPPTCPEYR